MIKFKGHKLVKDKDGYTLILYIDEDLYEFSEELTDNVKRYKNVQIDILKYIKENFSDIKLKTIKIMAGVLLLTSIPFSQINVHATEVKPVNTNIEQKYTVKSGDTLYKIAKKFGISVKRLKNINELTSSIIYPGQNLRIPYSSNFYTVRYGDTLYKIAKKFGTTVYKIKKINNLTSNMIIVGQKIKIPIERIYNYTVRDNDTLYKIASKFKITVNRIKYENELTNNMIYIGQPLKIPVLDSSALITNPNSIVVVVNKNNRLAEDFVPDNLTVPDVDFTFKEYSSKKLMQKRAADALEAMFNKAKEDNIKLYAISGYRSYSYQEYLFTSKVMNKGIEMANRTSAKPGESEHQTGLAMDVTSPSVNYQLSYYLGDTKEGIWLKENAHKFGFIIRYPEGKEKITGYNYEPWHLRYVGESAENIVKAGIALEEYMGIY